MDSPLHSPLPSSVKCIMRHLLFFDLNLNRVGGGEGGRGGRKSGRGGGGFLVSLSQPSGKAATYLELGKVGGEDPAERLGMAKEEEVGMEEKQEVRSG